MGDSEARSARLDAESPDTGQRLTKPPRPAKGPSRPAPLRRMAARFAKEIRDEHGLLDGETAEQLARLLKASVARRRKPGRRTSPEVLQALALRKQGVPWPKVYGQVIPGFWKLDLPERF